MGVDIVCFWSFDFWMCLASWAWFLICSLRFRVNFRRRWVLFLLILFDRWSNWVWCLLLLWCLWVWFMVLWFKLLKMCCWEVFWVRSASIRERRLSEIGCKYFVICGFWGILVLFLWVLLCLKVISVWVFFCDKCVCWEIFFWIFLIASFRIRVVALCTVRFNSFKFYIF